MKLTKLLLAMCLVTGYSNGTPIFASKSKSKQMTAESHPMLASVFSTANNAMMAEMEKRKHGGPKSGIGAPGNVGVIKGKPWSPDRDFMGAPSEVGSMKEIAGHVGKLEKPKFEAFPPVGGVKGINPEPIKNRPFITVVAGIANGVCSHCRKIKDLDCIRRYCTHDSTDNKLVPGNPMVSKNEHSIPNPDMNMIPIPNTMGNGKNPSISVPDFPNNMQVQLPRNTGGVPLIPHQGGIPQTNMGVPALPPNGHQMPDKHANFGPENIAVVPLSEMVHPNPPIPNNNANTGVVPVPGFGSGPVQPEVPRNIFPEQPKEGGFLPSPPLTPFIEVAPPGSNQVNEGIQQLNVPNGGPVIPSMATGNIVPGSFPNDVGFMPESQLIPVEPLATVNPAIPSLPTSNKVPGSFPGNGGFLPESSFIPIAPLAPVEPVVPSIPTSNAVPGSFPGNGGFMPESQLVPVEPLAPVEMSPGFAPVAPANQQQFVPVVPAQHVDLPNPGVNGPNAFQPGNTVPNAISFDNELTRAQLPDGSSNPNPMQGQSIVAPDGSMAVLDNLFHPTHGLMPILPESGALNPPATGPIDNNQPPLNSVMDEALLPLTIGNENANIADIRNQNLEDIIAGMESNSPSPVPSARPFDAMNPLTGHSDTPRPQPAGTPNQQNPGDPSMDTLVSVSRALDFFALKPHSQLSAIDQVSPAVSNDVSLSQTNSEGQIVQSQTNVQEPSVQQAQPPNNIGLANEFILNEAGQPIQTFSALNQKIRQMQETEQASAAFGTQSPVQQFQNIIDGAPSQIVPQSNVVQETTMAPVTIVTISPERKAELNDLSKSLLNGMMP